MSTNSICPPWCLLGDFNIFLYPFETSGPLPRRLSGIHEFKGCLQNVGLTDLHYEGDIFTWWDSNITDPLYRKLDRVLVNDTWLAHFDLSHAKFLNRGLSDHCPATISLGLPKDKVFKPFQVFNHLLEHEKFLPTVQEAWSSHFEGNPWHILISKLRIVKGALKNLNKDVGNLHDHVTSARDALNLF